VGITLDFEGVSPEDRENFSAFVQALAGELHAANQILAVTVPATDGNPASRWSAGFDDAAIGAAADRVIVMAYAYRTASGSPGPISPEPWVENVSAYALSKVPRDRLILGLGVWGYDWNLDQPGAATALRYADVVDRIAAHPGQQQYDQLDAAPSFSYRVDGQRHQIWYENAASVATKLAIGRSSDLAGVAVWRLGQEAPDVWSALLQDDRVDFPIANGWFYTQAGGGPGRGFRVVDDGPRFWSEFRRLGGVATLGYPSSRSYVGADGFTYQAFQRGILQWRPEIGQAYLANSFEMLTSAGKDPSLASAGIPTPIADDGSGGDWSKARVIRLGWLTNPAIASTFYANPSPSTIGSWDEARSIQLYGLPASFPVRSGPFVVQRFQRISLQLWVDDVPNMPPRGSVVGILGGDLVKQAGLIPKAAVDPDLSP
jgi:hypothetical protein